MGLPLRNLYQNHWIAAVLVMDQRRSKKERRRPRTAGGEGMRGKEGGRSRSKSPKRPKTSTGIRQTASALNIGEGDGKDFKAICHTMRGNCVALTVAALLKLSAT